MACVLVVFIFVVFGLDVELVSIVSLGLKSSVSDPDSTSYISCQNQHVYRTRNVKRLSQITNASSCSMSSFSRQLLLTSSSAPLWMRMKGMARQSKATTQTVMRMTAFLFVIITPLPIPSASPSLLFRLLSLFQLESFSLQKGGLTQR